MARLFVVNATGQNRIVNYRTEFTVDAQGNRTSERMRPYKHITVDARSQMQFGGDLSIKDIHSIVSQLERTCGAVPMKDIATAKAKGVVKMIWNVDAPVPVAVLKDVVMHNIAVLSEQGEDRRKRLAIGANAFMNNLSDPTTDTVRQTVVEYETVENTEDPDLPAPSLTEGLRVSTGPSKQRSGSRRKTA